MSKRNTFDMGVKFRVSFWEDYCQYCPQLARKEGDDIGGKVYYCTLFQRYLAETIKDGLHQIVRCAPCKANIK